jgi:superfamily I DNA/RNA helicase
VHVVDDEAAERGLVSERLKVWAGNGIAASEIGVFVRDHGQIPRAKAAVEASGLSAAELNDNRPESPDRVSVGTMHHAKGLEFKAVVVMACDDEVLPLQARIDSAADETELDDVYETERHLLYVACTRARDRLLVTGVKPGSEFLKDFEVQDLASIDLTIL